MTIWSDKRRRLHVLDDPSVVELWHGFGNGARAGNARWHGMLKLTRSQKWSDDDQEPAPNAFIEQLAALS
jgi:hypothetical protein